ncbi:MAG: hypothetical protein IT510_16255 [Sulfuritalea sp.]|jgi:hypothetical protein|nr:hypothetical protein [Sulfuritalea sp.]
MLLFWFLIIALAMAWGIVGFQEDELARRAPPPGHVSAPAATAPAPVAPPASTADSGDDRPEPGAPDAAASHPKESESDKVSDKGSESN